MTAVAPLLLVTGYASVDFAMQLAPFRGTDATTTVLGRADEWPRYGGVAHVTRAAAASRAADPSSQDAAVVESSVRVEALSWVGQDPDGAAWIDAVERGGAGSAGIATRGTRSPTSFLLYPEGDGTICLFDPGDCHAGALTSDQRRLAAAADAVVVTIGPAHATRELLDAIRPDATLCWILKQDPDSLSGDLATALAARADVITLSEGESGYLAGIAAAARPGTDIIVTRGSRGAELRRVTANATIEPIGSVPAEPVAGVDTTGAGDTFSGTLAARIAAEPARDRAHDTDPRPMLEHIAAAAGATAAMLRARATELGR
ncbi:carbohydrate kinase family protein [Leucobacter aridicollis]|uniref:carbohydrate kinase family protein n=1 Tax=Leucobacter aridicollis TaxID=283878 RepID=UPI0021680AB1|nr:carbohydrate kinase family protein [Leucobacter aridicollis]MCS3427978.1 ribokinase [Leucobacter aridicollis]